MGRALMIEVRQDQGHAVVTAGGKIGIRAVTRLRARLFELAASSCPLVVDLERVSLHRFGWARRAGRQPIRGL